MVKKFTRVVKEYADETALMAATHKDVKPGRPVKGVVSRGSYAIAWGDLRRIWFGLRAAGRCPVDERAHDAIKDALLTLQRRTNGALELAEDDPMPRDGAPQQRYRITWPTNGEETVIGLAAAAERLGLRPNSLSTAMSVGGGHYVKRVPVWDEEARDTVVREITCERAE